MRPVVTDRVAWSVGLSVCLSCLSVGLSVTLVSPAKTAEPIEMPFGLWTLVGPRNHVLDGGPDPPMGRGNFEGERCPLVKNRDTVVPCANTAEPIETPFGLLAQMGRRNHVLDGDPAVLRDVATTTNIL